LGGVGLYYWSANSAKWVKVNLPPTSAADSGKVLMSNGTTWTPVSLALGSAGTWDTLQLLSSPKITTFTKILDTIFTFRGDIYGKYIYVVVPGLRMRDICFEGGLATGMVWHTNVDVMVGTPIHHGYGTAGTTQTVVCYRPTS